MDRFFATILIVCSLVVGTTAGVASAATNWEYVGTEEGVDLYQRDAEQLGDTAFRGVYEVDVHIGKIITVFIDPDERVHWVYRYGEDRELDRDEERHMEWSERYWVRVDMPFPTTDRDYVFHTEYRFDEARRIVYAEIASVEDRRMGEQACCVRAESITNYTVEAIEGRQRTRITVEVETDLGGMLPGWITGRAEREWPVETLTALVERARADGVEIDERVAGWHDE